MTTQLDAELAELVAPKLPSKLDIAALTVGIIPFSVSIHTSNSFGGYKDYVAIAGGNLAIVLALTTIKYWSKVSQEKRAQRILLTVAAAGLGLYQVIVRGGALS